VIYSIGVEDTGYFSENRKHDNAVYTECCRRTIQRSEFSNPATDAGKGLPNPRRMSQYAVGNAVIAYIAVCLQIH